MTTRGGHTLAMMMVLLTLTGIYSTILFSYVTSAPKFAHSLLCKREAVYLAESGIVRAEAFLNENISWSNEEYHEELPEYGSIDLICRDWGGYKRVISRGYRKRDSSVVKAFITRNVPTTFDTSIVLTGTIGGLVIDFNTRIENKVVLNNGSVRRGKYKEPIAGSEEWTITRESDTLPFEVDELDSWLIECRKQSQSTSGHSLLTGTLTGEMEVADTVIHSGNLTVTSGEFRNKKIICHGTFTVGKGAILDLCEVYAEKIRCEGGVTTNSLFWGEKGVEISEGKHDSQFFSGQNISATGGSFSSQSFFLCRFLPTDTTEQYGIQFGKESSFAGTVISIIDSSDGIVQRPAIQLDSTVTIRGHLITNGDISIKDNVIMGSLWARSLVAEEDGVIYKNWLFRTSILANKETLAFPLIGSKPIELHRSLLP